MNIIAAPDHKVEIDPGRRFEALLLASAAIVWWTDPDGKFVERQPHWEAYTGQAWNAYRGTRWILAIHPDDREAVTADWATAVSSGELLHPGPHLVGQTQILARLPDPRHRRARSPGPNPGMAGRAHRRPGHHPSATSPGPEGRRPGPVAEGPARERIQPGRGQERARREASALRRLAEASDHLWQSRDLDTGLQEILTASIRLVGADKGSMQTLDAQGILHIRAQQGSDRDFLEFFREVRADNKGASGKALATRKPVFIPDIELDPDYRPYVGPARMAGFRSVLSFPIISPGGNLLGVMTTHFAEPKIVPAEALKVFDLYAKLAACFMDRVAHEEQVQFLSAEVNHRAKNSSGGGQRHRSCDRSSAGADRLQRADQGAGGDP